PKGRALLGIGYGHTQGRYRHANIRRRVGKTVLGQQAQRQVETLALTPQEIGVWYDTVFEHQLGWIVGANHRDQAHRQPWRATVHKEARDALAALAGISAYEHDTPLGLDATRDPGFGAIDHPVVAVAHTTGLNRPGRVGPTAGLGDRKEGFFRLANGG